MGSPQTSRILSTRKFLTFRLGKQDCAIDASRVRGILSLADMIPRCPPAEEVRALLQVFGEASSIEKWTFGFAALHGRAFPVIDLKAKLEWPEGSPGRQPCVLAVEIDTGFGPQIAGFVVDGISKIVQARPRDSCGGRLRAGGRPRRIIDPSVLL